MLQIYLECFYQIILKGINSFDYIEQFNSVTEEFTEQILKEFFDEKNVFCQLLKQNKNLSKMKKNEKYENFCKNAEKYGIFY